MCSRYIFFVMVSSLSRHLTKIVNSSVLNFGPKKCAPSKKILSSTFLRMTYSDVCNMNSSQHYWASEQASIVHRTSYICACACACARACAYVRMHMCMSICTRAYVHICTCVYVHMCVCILDTLWKLFVCL